MLDLKLSGGEVHDGTGAPARRADVGVAGGRIAAVGDLAGEAARETIDAAGRLVAPGFVDVHSHSDAYLLLEPSAPSKIHQGITTEVVGNCGASAAPRLGGCRMPSDWAAQRYPGAWHTVAGYRALLEAARPAPNVALLAGHNNLRASVLGYANRPATPDERRAMVRLLEQALDEGACGFSTGLIYAPGMYAPAEEIAELAGVAAARGGVYATHLRSESARLLEALDETIAVARATGGRVEVSHLKTAGRRNWPKIDAALDRLRAARAEGLAVAADRYPYTASCTDLDSRLPDWAAEGSREEILARLREPAVRARIRAELVGQHGPDYWETVWIGSTAAPANRPHQGRPLVEVARALGLEPVDAALHLLDTDELRTGGVFFGMSEENMARILAEPWVMIGSDGSLRAPQGPLSHDHPHPRCYGAFPRFLRMSLDGRTVGVAEAIRKMTSLPARHFGLAGRGEVREGFHADLVVLDPGRVADRATYGEPHRLAEGVVALVVNGVVTLREGTATGARAGRFLAP